MSLLTNVTPETTKSGISEEHRKPEEILYPKINNLENQENRNSIDLQKIDLKKGSGVENDDKGSNDKNIDFESYHKDIDPIFLDERFKKIFIGRDKGDYYVLGRLYCKTLNEVEKLGKIKFDISLKHQRLPNIYGFESSGREKALIEIRKFDFEPFPVTKEVFDSLSALKKIKMINQIVDFFNYISSLNHSITLLTIYDLSIHCFLDSDSNIYFGDLSFIEPEYNYNKTLFSLGCIIYQLFGYELIIDDSKYVRKPTFDENFPNFWRIFIEATWIEKVSVTSFYSPFIKEKDSHIYESAIKDKYLQDILDFKIEHVEYEWKFNIPKIINHPKTESSLNDLLQKYQALKYVPITVREDDKLKKLNAELKEDGNLVFVEKLVVQNINDIFSMFSKQMELKHPMILPLKGFDYSSNPIKEILFYRESGGKFSIITEETFKKASSELKIKWMKQFFDLFSYLIESTNYRINKSIGKLDKSVALNSNNDIVFVNLEYFRFYEGNNHESNLKKKIKDIWKVFSEFFPSIDLPQNIPCIIKNIFEKRKKRNENHFIIVKRLLENFDPEFNYVKTDTLKYLEDFFIEKECVCSHCNVTYYRRKLLSNKKIKRLVMKRYGYKFSKKQIKTIMIFNHYSVLGLWTEENETFMLMNYIEAKRLKDLIPTLSNDQKYNILLKIIEMFYRRIYNLSVSNIYVEWKEFIRLVDCNFVVDESDDPLLVPEVKNLSKLSKENKEKVYVFTLGVIAYEIYGGIYDQDKDFKFDGMPPFIEEFIRMCCNKNIEERINYDSAFDFLYNHRKIEVRDCIQEIVSEVSNYQIDLKDIEFNSEDYSKTKHMTKYVQISTNKKLFSVSTNRRGIIPHDLKSLIEASKCRNSIDFYGFIIKDQEQCQILHEDKNYQAILLNGILNKELQKYDLSIKLVLFWKLAQFINDADEFVRSLDKIVLLINEDKEIKFNLKPDDRTESEVGTSIIKQYVTLFCNSCTLKGRHPPTRLTINLDVPLFVQALVRKTLILLNEKDEQEIWSLIEKAFEGMSSNLENDKFDEEQECHMYESKENADLIEEGIRVEILMKCSNLVSYKRRMNVFYLLFDGECDESFFDYLYCLESMTWEAAQEREKLKGYEVESEYQGEHCLVQILKNGCNKKVLKKYPRGNNSNILQCLTLEITTCAD